ncbi:MAG: glycosyltransferase family 4 protein [Verrucomicrobiaceae bacterium]
MNEKLSIAYATRGQADDPGNWSGIVRHIKHGLIEAGHDVQVIDGLSSAVPLLSRLRGRLVRAISGKTYAYDRDFGVSRHFARQVENRLADMEVDCVVCPVLPTAAQLRTKLPVAIWDDGPFHCLRQLYSQYGGLAEDSLRQGDALDAVSIRKATLLAFASQWAADDALNYHKADPAKTIVVPFGANCPSPFHDEAEAIAALEAKPTSPLRLLFVGIDWERKGGPLTLDIIQELRRRGVNAELTIVGCNPFDGEPPKGVHCLGKLNKGNPAHAKQWQDCFREAQLFIMPTRGECFGVVYAEAAAHALPSLGTRVGGVPDAIAEGVSGWLFDLEDGPAKYCDLLQSLAADPARLREQGLLAFRHQKNVLNWDRSVEKFDSALQSRMTSPTGATQRTPAHT